jgi:hypothetical protein
MAILGHYPGANAAVRRHAVPEPLGPWASPSLPKEQAFASSCTNIEGVRPNLLIHYHSLRSTAQTDDKWADTCDNKGPDLRRGGVSRILLRA